LVGVEKYLDINTEVKVNVGENENSCVSTDFWGGGDASSIHRTLEAAGRLKKNPNGPTRNTSTFSIQRCTWTWVEAQGGPFKRQSEDKVFM